MNESSEVEVFAAGPQRVAAYLIFTLCLVRLADLAFLLTIGLNDGTFFSISQSVVALILGLGVLRGYRIAWAIAMLLYGYMSYLGLLLIYSFFTLPIQQNANTLILFVF